MYVYIYKNLMLSRSSTLGALGACLANTGFSMAVLELPHGRYCGERIRRLYPFAWQAGSELCNDHDRITDAGSMLSFYLCDHEVTGRGATLVFGAS